MIFVAVALPVAATRRRGHLRAAAHRAALLRGGLDRPRVDDRARHAAAEGELERRAARAAGHVEHARARAQPLDPVRLDEPAHKVLVARRVVRAHVVARVLPLDDGHIGGGRSFGGLANICGVGAAKRDRAARRLRHAHAVQRRRVGLAALRKGDDAPAHAGFLELDGEIRNLHRRQVAVAVLGDALPRLAAVLGGR